MYLISGFLFWRSGCYLSVMGKKMTIAVDFDGVLHRYSRGFGDGSIYDPPVEGAREAMEKLKADGHRILIYSTRSNKIYKRKKVQDQDQAMEDWLKEHSIPYDRIWTYAKPMADIYIDDRAIGFRGNWEETLHEIGDFVPWTKKEE